MLNHPNKFKSALIIGIGTGQEMEPLISSGIQHIEAVDLSSKMLEVSGSKFPDACLHYGDFMTFSEFQKKSYDLIVSCGVVECINDFPGFLKKVSLLLAPSGLVLLTFTPILLTHPIQSKATSMHPVYPGHMERRYRFEQFYAYVQEAGMSIRKCFMFDCHISGSNTIRNQCFFCVLEK